MKGKQPDNPARTAALLKLLTGGFLCCFLVFIYLLTEDLDNSSVRVQAPGATTVDIKRTGKYTLYPAPKTDNESSGTDLALTVKSEKSGSEISVTRVKARTPSISTGKNRKTGNEAFSFLITEPGAYECTLTYSGESPKSPRIFIISGGASPLLTEGVFWSSLLFLMSLVTTIFSGTFSGMRPGGEPDAPPPPCSSSYGAYYNFSADEKEKRNDRDDDGGLFG